jgi:energy-coupling factor transporter transmembrane protein EcfT
MAKSKGAFVYEGVDSPFQRLHPTTRIVYTIAAVGISFATQHPYVLAALFLVEVIVAMIAKMSKTMTLVFIGLIGTGALITFLMWVPFGSDVGELVFEIPLLFGKTIKFTDLGLLWAPAMGLRILTSSLPVFLLLASTKPREITIGLSQLGIPSVAGTLFVMAFRFVPLVQNDASVIIEAQKARGLDLSTGKVTERAKKAAAILAPLIFMSLRRIQLVANSLDTKGFRNMKCKHRYYEMPIFKAVDIVLVSICTILFCFSIYARFKGFGIIIPTRV